MKRDAAFRALLALALLVLGFALPLPDAMAQQPPDSSLVQVGVSTDREQYEPGQPINVRVTVTNRRDVPVTLYFTSSLQADYAVDNAWQWSEGRGFLTVMTSYVVQPNATQTIGAFSHLPSDFFVAPGPHVIRGIVTGYGEAATRIMVGREEPPPPPALMLTPFIIPSPVAFGAPVDLVVTVTNVSGTVQQFGHGGCPVYFTIDGWFQPRVACPEYYRQVILQPGESIRFGPGEYGYLRLEPPQVGAVLTPGWHSIEFQVDAVGTTAARLYVEGGAGGSVAGTCLTPEGTPVPGAEVLAMTMAPPADSTGGGGPEPTRGIFSTFTDEIGAYRFGSLPAGLYYMSARGPDGTVVWYPGVATPDQAIPIPVAEGSVTEGIDFILRGVEPPPPLPGVILARVHEALPPGSMACCPPPLPGAVVAAIPALWEPGIDDSVPPPNDSTLVPRDEKVPGPWPPMPPDGYRPVYYGISDEFGMVSIRVPFGAFHLVAFDQVHAYQWWENASNFADARIMYVHPGRGPIIEARFELEPLPPGPAVLSIIAGQVRGAGDGVTDTVIVPPPLPGARDHDPTDPNGSSTPLAGAVIVARPLVQDPRIMTIVPVLYRTETDAEGRYQLDVPPNVPYLVQSWAEGYEPQYWDHQPGDFWATPVDVRPATRTDGIDFDLYHGWVPPPTGMLAGYVYHRVAGLPLGSPDVTYPLAGALVRVRSAGGFGPFEVTALTAEDGSFAVAGLPIVNDESSGYLVSAEAPGFIPGYYPGVPRWQDATLEQAWGPNERHEPLRLVLNPPASAGPHLVVGLVRGNLNGLPLPGVDPGTGTGGGSDGSGGSGGDPGAPGLAGAAARIFDRYDSPLPPDTLDSYWPLTGAFLFLVPADDPTAAPVAAGVACDNGTVVMTGVGPGRYKAFADHPGFETGWFRGATPWEAAVVVVGPGIETTLLDIVLEAVDGGLPVPGGGSEDDLAAPRAVRELRNSPNPFRPQTTIIYRLMMATEVSVQVFDLNGRLVRTLADRQPQIAGEQQLPWDGRDNQGQPIGAGIYFYKVWTPVEQQTGKMVMLR